MPEGLPSSQDPPSRRSAQEPPPGPARRRRAVASIRLLPAVVLPIIAATLGWFAYDEYQQTLEQEYRFLEAHARIADSNLAGLIRNIKQLLGRIAEERPALQPAQFAAYEATLAERKREFPEIRTLAVVNAEGRVEITVNPTLHGFDSSRRDYYTAHRDREQTPNFHITRPFKSSFGDYSVTFSVAIRDSRHRFLGVAVAGVNYKFFDGVMKPIMPEGAGSIAGIFNRQGDIIYRTPDPDRYAGVSIAGAAPFQAYARSGKPMFRSIGVAATDGTERIYVHRAIGDAPLGVAVARPTDEVFAAWRHNLVLRALIFAFAAAVTLTLAGVAQRRQREALAGKEFADRLIETVNAMLVGLDAAGAVVIFNEAAEQVSGYRREEVLGRPWFDLAVPDGRYPQLAAALRRDSGAGALPRSFESPILTRAGAERAIAWQASEIRQPGAAAVTLLFGMDITERQEMEAARRNEEVSRRLVLLQEEERRRLAVELHDRASPNLSALGINLRLIADALPSPMPEKMEHLLQDTGALLEDSVASIRAISADFRPQLLDYAGLWPALEGYAQQFSRRTGIAVHTASSGCEARLAPDAETHLFRIAQEALTNCAKHSQAKTVRIGQARIGDAIELAIADDGVGFDAAALGQADKPGGHGLTTMRRRAEFMGGTFSLDTGPGRGTRIVVEIPAVARAAAEPGAA